MLCPQCQVPLSITERQGIEIDWCNQCRGVWLDRGELDKLIERSHQAMAAPLGRAEFDKPRGYDRDDDDDRRYRDSDHRWESKDRDDDYRGNPTRKRKSFLADLLDFD